MGEKSSGRRRLVGEKTSGRWSLVGEKSSGRRSLVRGRDQWRENPSRQNIESRSPSISQKGQGSAHKWGSHKKEIE